eukprot:scaffold76456_cov24-Tisochrysis_lutea.AAC.1
MSRRRTGAPGRCKQSTSPGPWRPPRGPLTCRWPGRNARARSCGSPCQHHGSPAQTAAIGRWHEHSGERMTVA